MVKKVNPGSMQIFLVYAIDMEVYGMKYQSGEVYTAAIVIFWKQGGGGWHSNRTSAHGFTSEDPKPRVCREKINLLGNI